MTERELLAKETREDMEALVAEAMKEPGVAEAMEVYEKAESIYAMISDSGEPAQFAASSTSD